MVAMTRQVIGFMAASPSFLKISRPILPLLPNKPTKGGKIHALFKLCVPNGSGIMMKIVSWNIASRRKPWRTLPVTSFAAVPPVLGFGCFRHLRVSENAHKPLTF